MIVHPDLDRHRLITCGGRLLDETFGLVGVVLGDPYEPQREWTIQGFYLPIPRRAVGGVRAKVTDQKGFISFINQRDLEVISGLADVGQYCRWLGQDYVGPDDRGWLGYCLDEEDLHDDLFVRELELRLEQKLQTGNTILPSGLEIERRLHLNNGTDCKELSVMREDIDRVDGLYPDTRFETLDIRWARVGRERVLWRQV